MSIAEFSVRRPVFMSMVYALLAIVSIVFVPKLDQAIFPSVNLPYLVVYASCGDADPESVEMQVTRVLENAVSGTEHLMNITSYSQTGRSVIQLEFNYGTDTNKAESDVNGMVSMVNRTLPSWVSSVNTMQVNSMIAGQAFMTLSVDGPYPVEELKNIATNT
ncbi:MAG TPA: AcrB/AcrD/AcrF family protein, partial [Spirochaetaceae bacterium]|nr:AcrB/AcrD/AcrF family protein [Spirochaetaceae bacterium]